MKNDSQENQRNGEIISQITFLRQPYSTSIFHCALKSLIISSTEDQDRSQNGCWCPQTDEKLEDITCIRIQLDITRVRYRVEHEHTNDDFFYDFPKISEHFPKISEDFPKVDRRVRRRDKRFLTSSEDYRRYPS